MHLSNSKYTTNVYLNEICVSYILKETRAQSHALTKRVMNSCQETMQTDVYTASAACNLQTDILSMVVNADLKDLCEMSI